MQHDITKKCADSLRSFAQNNYGIQIKSAHAHELVAAYFGYSSRAALIADTNCPITNLRQAEFVVLTPAAPIKERCKELKELPENLPHELADGVYLPLYDENDKWILTKIWPNLEELGKALADQYLKSKPTYFSDQRVQRQGVKLEFENDLVAIFVFREYVSPYLTLTSGKNVLRGVVDVFNLKRVAGFIGYVQTNHYSAEAETLDGAIIKMRDFYHEIISSPRALEIINSHKEDKLSFADWLEKQKNRDTPLGDLASKRGFADKSNGWPVYCSLKEYQDYLTINHPPLGAMPALERAWKSYQNYLQKAQSPTSVRKEKKISSKVAANRKIVSVKNATPLHYSKRTIEKFNPGDTAWISWDGKKAIPVSIVEVDERRYSVRIEIPRKEAGSKHTLFLDEVRSSPKLACENLVTF